MGQELRRSWGGSTDLEVARVYTNIRHGPTFTWNVNVGREEVLSSGGDSNTWSSGK